MKLFVSAIIIVGCLCGCAVQQEGSETLVAGSETLSREARHAALTQRVNFGEHVRPILEAKCVVCHSAEAQPKGIHLESRAAAERSGVLRGFVTPGHPERSLLLTKIEGAHASIKAMPPVGERLTKDEVRILERWIRQGAVWE